MYCRRQQYRILMTGIDSWLVTVLLPQQRFALMTPQQVYYNIVVYKSRTLSTSTFNFAGDRLNDIEFSFLLLNYLLLQNVKFNGIYFC